MEIQTTISHHLCGVLLCVCSILHTYFSLFVEYTKRERHIDSSPDEKKEREFADGINVCARDCFAGVIRGFELVSEGVYGHEMPYQL